MVSFHIICQNRQVQVVEIIDVVVKPIFSFSRYGAFLNQLSISVSNSETDCSVIFNRFLSVFISLPAS